MERIKLLSNRRRVSWGSIIAGVVTVLSLSILLSMIGTSIGLFMFHPTENDPASGIGTTVGIWTVITLLISLFAGGFVSGKLAGADGMIHGFLVWSGTVIIAVILGIWLMMGAVKLTANVLGAVSSVTGSVLSGVGSAVGQGASALGKEVKSVFDNIDFNVDDNSNNVPRNVREALRKSGVKELQPNYLNNQMKAVKRDFDKSVKKLVTHPKDADNIINSFLDRLQNRANKWTQNINKEDLVQALANNSDLSRAEAEKTVDQYIDLTNQGIAKAKQQINNLEEDLQQAKQDLQQMKQQALEQAEEASQAAARSTLISFFAMLVGAVLCAWAGFLGTRKTKEGYEV